MIRASYQTAPLTAYRPELQALARALYDLIRTSLPEARAIEYKGSYSFLVGHEGRTAAKVIIVQHGLGRLCNGWYPEDGVYALVRVERDDADTVGVAPKHLLWK